MECTAPGATTAEDLLAYADGEVDPAVRAHVLGCAACGAIAREYARAGHRLAGALYRFDCPDAMVLGEYELDRLPSAERAAVATHVVGCAACGDELALLRAFLKARDPESVVGGFSRARLVVATLLAPGPGRAGAALRGDDGHIRTYRADELTVTIEAGWDARRRRGTIMGLLSAPDDAPPLAESVVTLYDADNIPISSTTIDEVGSFSFETAMAGTYRVDLALGERVVTIEGTYVGPGKSG